VVGGEQDALDGFGRNRCRKKAPDVAPREDDLVNRVALGKRKADFFRQCFIRHENCLSDRLRLMARLGQVHSLPR
jgi:hypothetical protein